MGAVRYNQEQHGAPVWFAIFYSGSTLQANAHSRGEREQVRSVTAHRPTQGNQGGAGHETAMAAAPVQGGHLGQFREGQLVWAHVAGSPYWPARVSPAHLF